jgi:superfamily II DNA or RNA helicase
MLILHDWQEDAIQRIRDALKESKRILLYSPTGSGKTEMGMSIIRSAQEKSKNVGFVCHRINLVQQASRRFYRSHIPHGIVQGANTRRTWEKTLICSIQTLESRGYVDGVDVLIIDEAHNCTSESYKKFIAAHPDIPIIGLSATPFTKGLGLVFDKLVVATTIRELIGRGFLVDCEIYAPTIPDLTGVKIVRGDYDEKQLGHAMDKTGLVGDIVEHWKKLSIGMPTVVFATNIAHSKHIAEKFVEQGVSAEHLDCYTPEEDRAAIMGRLNDGQTQVVCNVDILTEGWDEPKIQCVVNARPTRSMTKWIQRVGRALRPYHGKTIATILDHSGTCHLLGYPTDDLPLELSDGKKKTAADKTDGMPQEECLPHLCPNCHFMVPPGLAACPKCGAIPQKKNKVHSTDGELKKVERSELTNAEKQELWSSCLGLREARNEKRAQGKKPRKPLSTGWAANLYKSMTHSYPTGLENKACAPLESVVKMATANDIRFIHRRK